MKQLHLMIGGIILILFLVLLMITMNQNVYDKEIVNYAINKSMGNESYDNDVMVNYKTRTVTFGEIRANSSYVDNKIVSVEYTNNESLDVSVDIDEPKIKLSKWDEEANALITLNPDKPDNVNASRINMTLEYDDYDYDIRALPVDNINEEGGIEFDIVLKKRPKTNVFMFSIDTENLNFFYQPPLDIEYNDSSCNATDCHGSHRPINVVGSYAVYHKYKKNNQYKTGKAFHIYRPKVYDKDGNWVWGKLSIDGSILSINVDDDFLENARYPVTIDPTIGYTSAGASYQDANQYISGSLHSGQSGWLVSSTAYMKFNRAAASGGYAMAIYYENNSLLDETDFETLSASYTGWKTRSFIYGRFISVCDNYDLVYSGDRGIKYNSIYIYYDSGSTDQGGREAYDVRGNNGFPDPWNPTRNNNLYSVYITYTESPDCDGCDVATECTTHSCFNITNGTDVIAIFDELGSVDVKRNLTIGNASTANFTIVGSNGSVVASFNELGDMQLLDSYLYNQGGYCQDPSEGFVIKDSSGNCVSFIDKNGTMWLRGNFCYNANI